MSHSIPAPEHIRYKELKDNQTEVLIEPCYPGYGMTIGNALRRVLLSSLPGSAVCAVKIQGVQHEYDTIEYMKEDFIEMMMHLKNLHVALHSDEPVILTLSAKGEKVVTAGDIKKDSQVDIINKDLVIANLTDKKADLQLEITVKNGIGYEPVEERAVDKKDIGTIQIDSRYSPIVNVGFKVDAVRVGQRTDYEKITLMVTTDGSLTAEDAVNTSIMILQQQFASLITTGDDKPEKKTTKKKESKTDKAEKEESAEEPKSDEASPEDDSDEANEEKAEEKEEKKEDAEESEEEKSE